MMSNEYIGLLLFGKTWLLREALKFVEIDVGIKTDFAKDQSHKPTKPRKELNDPIFELLISWLQKIRP